MEHIWQVLNHQMFWKILMAVIEAISGYLLGSMVRKLIIRFNGKAIDKGILTFTASFASVALTIAGIVMALDQIGVSMNLIIGAISAFSVGITLALKDNMASVACGLQILLTKPFEVGDYIKVESKEGYVASIELTYTVLQTNADNTVLIPNNKAIFKKVVNYSMQNDRRLIIDYLCQRNEIGTVRQKLLEAADQSRLILRDHKPEVWINQWYYNGVELQLVVYTRPQDYWNASTEINNLIHDLLQSDDPVKIVNEQDRPKPLPDRRSRLVINREEEEHRLQSAKAVSNLPKQKVKH